MIRSITSLPCYGINKSGYGITAYIKRVLTLFTIFMSSVFYLSGQTPPVKEWDKSFGGLTNDAMYIIIQCTDGGYLLGGDSDSPISGDKSQGSQGLSDYWVVKIDAAGIKQWDKRFGGNSREELFALLQTPDGGYLLGGWTMSVIVGDVTVESRGARDYWVVKIDANGNKLWDQRYGGFDDDELRAMDATSDGGFILAGESKSGIGGDKTQDSRGSYDAWVVKTDMNGDLLWDARYGGLGDDRLNAIQQTPDGGYIIGCWTVSPIGGDVTQAERGASDMWIVKTDINGIKLWDGRYGGSNNEYLYSIDQTHDGGFILGGYTRSGVNGDVTVPGKGDFDYWMVKTDGNGVKLWDKRYGGSKDDKGKSIFETSDGGFIMGGWSESGMTGDKTQDTRGATDYWLLKTDINGDKLWDLDFGANNEERLHNAPPTSDGGYIIAGHSFSNMNGDKSQPNNGINDYWIVKLQGTAPTETFYADADGDGFGNAAVDTLAGTAPDGYVLNNTDCNDGDIAVYPGATEVCNAGVDDDCDGLKDDADPSITGQGTYYTDGDGDSYGAGDAILACLQSPGISLTNDDCNDGKAAVNPGATEVCNTNVDDDCDGLKDDADPSVTGQGTYYTDGDGDSYGSGDAILACVQSSAISLTNNDCNDANTAVNPGAADICNGVDDNCDLTLDENPLAAPVVTPAGTITACKSAEVTLTTGFDPQLSYQWYRTNTPQTGATSNTFTTTKDGSFSVKVTSVATCSASSATTTVVRIDKPNATITPLGNLDICEAGSVILQANGGDGFLYQWKKGSSLIDGATNVSYTATSTGNYRVIVSTIPGCTKTSASIKVTKSCKDAGLIAASSSRELSVYPNPATNQLTMELDLSADVTAEATIQLIDLTGRMMQTSKAPVANGYMLFDLSLDDAIVNGSYIVKVLVGDQLLAKVIAVQR